MKLLLARKSPGKPWYDYPFGTSLTLTSLNGHTALVKLLLDETDIGPNHPNKFGYIALWAAASRGHQDVVALLMRNDDVDVNHRDHFGQTALMRACKPGGEQMAAALIEEGCCNVEAVDMHGRYALFYAIFWKSPTTIAMLLRAAPSMVDTCDLNGGTPLHHASRQNSKDMVQLLLQWGAQLDAQDSGGIAPLMWPVPHFPAKAAESLQKAGADVTLIDYKGANVLHHCAMTADASALELFLEAVNNAGSLQSITAHDHWADNLLHSLLSGVGCYAGTLRRCRQVSLSRIIAVQRLLRFGVSVQERNRQGMTPLARYLDITSPLIPNKKVCELLFQAGSDADWRSSTGQTLAHLYAQGRDDYMELEVLRTLQTQGVDLSAVGVNGQTILHYLVRHRGLTAEIAGYLFWYTTLDINHTDSQSRTAIQLLSPEPADKSYLSNTEKEVEKLRAIMKIPAARSAAEPEEATSADNV